jgi:hypothetical protein
MPRTKQLPDTALLAYIASAAMMMLPCAPKCVGRSNLNVIVRVRAMAEAVSHRPVIGEDRLQSQTSPSKIWRGHSGTRTRCNATLPTEVQDV